MSTPIMSVVVPTRDRADRIARCLQALLGQEEPPAEILVVDQSRGEGTAAVCGAYGDRVRYVDDRRGQGLSRSHNVGVRLATGDLIACIDDDCYAEPDWSRAFREVLARHPEADGAFGAMLPHGDVPESASGITVSTIDFPAERVHRGRTPPHWVGFGGNFVLRQTVWRRLGESPCDERLGPGTANPGADDMDLIHRLLRAGAVLVSAPSARVLHDQHRPRSLLVRQMFGYGRGAGAFAGKHLAHGDPYALALLARTLGADLRFIASGVRRRSPLRLRVGAARLGGTLRGLAAGLRVGPGWQEG